MHFWLNLHSIKHVFIKFAKYKPIKMKRRNQKSSYLESLICLPIFVFFCVFFYLGLVCNCTPNRLFSKAFVITITVSLQHGNMLHVLFSTLL